MILGQILLLVGIFRKVEQFDRGIGLIPRGRHDQFPAIGHAPAELKVGVGIVNVDGIMGEDLTEDGLSILDRIAVGQVDSWHFWLRFQPHQSQHGRGHVY